MMLTTNSDPSVIDIANVEELPAVTEEATTSTTTTTTTEKEEDPTTTVRSSTRDEALFSQIVIHRICPAFYISMVRICVTAALIHATLCHVYSDSRKNAALEKKLLCIDMSLRCKLWQIT